LCNDDCNCGIDNCSSSDCSDCIDANGNCTCAVTDAAEKAAEDAADAADKAADAAEEATDRAADQAEND
jgi:hypothetical protein